MTPRILAFAGSLRRDSFNQKLVSIAAHGARQAGAVMMNWFAVACELQRDWRRDMEGLANLLGGYIPAYKNLMTAYSTVAKK